MTTRTPFARPQQTHELSTPQLISQAVDNATALIRDEVALAKAEIKKTLREAVMGAGLFGAAGVAALFGLGALVTAAIAGLATVLDLWLAALIVAVVLLGVAAGLAFMGKKKVSEAPPPIDKTQANVQRDIATVKEARS